MVAAAPVRVVIVPVWLLPAAPVVNVLVETKLKQYNVPTTRSVLEKVTTLPVTLVASAPIPGHAMAPLGKFVVVTSQFVAVAFTVKSVPATVGKVICTSDSVPTVCGFAQMVPPVAVEADKRSNRTITS